MLKNSIISTTPIYTISYAEAVETKSHKKPVIAGVVICIVLFIIIGVVVIGIGVGVGVGVGFGLKKNSDESPKAVTSAPIASSSSTTARAIGASSCALSTCGCSNVKPSVSLARIYQGTIAEANSWSWVVAIYLNNNRRLCGGFLISYQHVITAAHCLLNVTASSIQVYAGLQELSQRSNALSRSVSNFVIHPSFTASSFTNDIGVITLSTPFTQISTIGVCCLPSSSSSPTIGESGVIAGWGVTETDPSTPSDDLRQAVIQVQADSSSCSVGSSSSIRFCAGGSGSDACFGDSGGPFMSYANNAWTCTGLVSSGTKCGTTSFYTRIAAYRSFIRQVTGV